MAYESMIFKSLREACNGQYQGVFWEYYALSNGGFYMELKQDEALNMECEFWLTISYLNSYRLEF